MKLWHRIISLALFLMLVACGPSFTPALQSGDAVPPGSVLVIGKVVIDPSWFTAKDIKRQGGAPPDIRIGMTHDLPKEAKEGKFYMPDEAINPNLNEFFYYPLSPGTRYIRSGQVFKVRGHYISGTKGGQAVYYVLNLYRNVKIRVPENAKAVYIGTIVYQHDGKHAKSVAVRDDYRRAVRDLGKRNIQGIRPSDVKKRLAVVVR